MDRRRQLLDVALDLFDERGVRGGSMRELARRAGVDVAATYHHFESKRALLRALFEDLGHLDRVSGPMEPEILDVFRNASPEEALALILEASWEGIEEHAPYFRLIHVEVMYGDADAKAVGRELWDGWGRQIEQMVEAGGLASGDQVPALARTLRALVWGVFHEARLTGEQGPKARRERAAEIVEVLSAGL